MSHRRQTSIPLKQESRVLLHTTGTTVPDTPVTLTQHETGTVDVGCHSHRRPSPTVTPRSLHLYVSTTRGTDLRQTNPDPKVLPRHDINEFWAPHTLGHTRGRDLVTEVRQRSVERYNESLGRSQLTERIPILRSSGVTLTLRRPQRTNEKEA